MSGANQSYPQTVNLDIAKDKAAALQSETSKAQGGNINPTDPASKARVRLNTLLVRMHACQISVSYAFLLGFFCLGGIIDAQRSSERTHSCADVKLVLGVVIDVMPHEASALLHLFTIQWAFLQSAASQSQHVVNILTSGDPVNAGDVEKVEADERNNNNTGLLAQGGPTAKVQVRVSTSAVHKETSATA